MDSHLPAEDDGEEKKREYLQKVRRDINSGTTRRQVNGSVSKTVTTTSQRKKNIHPKQTTTRTSGVPEETARTMVLLPTFGAPTSTTVGVFNSIIGIRRNTF